MNQDVIPSRVASLDPAAIASALPEFETVLASGQHTDGPYTRRLEERASDDLGRTAIATGSGMDALELVLETVAPGSDVLVPANCFQSIPALAYQLGRTPIPVDVDDQYMAPAFAAVAAHRRPGVAIWVHHCGMVHPQAQHAIQDLQAAGWSVIEDCAYLVPDGTKAGPGHWGDAAIWSFSPTKPIPAAGGGLIVAPDVDLAQELAARRPHGGQEARWADGGSFERERRIGELRAALAYHQWIRLEHIRARLAEVAAGYESSLRDELPALLVDGRRRQATWGKYTVALPDGWRAVDVRDQLQDRGIGCSVMYERPWFDYPWFTRRRSDTDEHKDWGHLRELLDRSLCLPFFPSLDASTTIPQVTAALLSHLRVAPVAGRQTERRAS